MAEVHEGVCGAHQAGIKMRWLIRRHGHYWPTIMEDYIQYAKGCQACQKHVAAAGGISWHTLSQHGYGLQHVRPFGGEVFDALQCYLQIPNHFFHFFCFCFIGSFTH
ncbi:hypothetical protein RJ639_009162 [Escallonia herrerae]|uniref:Integrase zinc-binding domain-containing protein n=1 Tax=Escallonia herrerae TaxID=1293975 RepID=A0AA88VUL3_9ASTE|nr:hypothetical protein RJ639_009162 [Escallonia herrerae]